MRTQTSPAAENIVQWTFQYGKAVLTCGVERHAGTGYVVSIVPGGRSAAALVEVAESLLAALRRHAVIAAHLRDHGWTLTAYAGARAVARRSHRRAA